MIQHLTVMGGSSNAKIHNLDRGKSVHWSGAHLLVDHMRSRQRSRRKKVDDRLNDGDDGLKGNL